nr:ABC transporter substrate binding protein [uncultured Desulfobacter sp.]
MTKKIPIFLFVIFAFTAIQSPSSYADSYNVTPTTNSGTKWRIGYYEGGNYIDYRYNLEGYIKALMELNWIKKQPLPKPTSAQNIRELWQWLADSIKSDYLIFVKDAYYSCDWNHEIRINTKKNVIGRLSNKKDIDLMLAMGTWAGQDLANNNHSVPVIVMASANPIQAKIVKSLEDSGFDHVTAKCDPGRYLRQLKLFHDLINFKNLGVVYEDSESGRIYANLADINQVAKKRNFNVVECHATESNVSEKKARDNLYNCWRSIAPKIDALWITVHNGEQPKFMPEILEPIFKYKIPSWTRRNSDQVARGVLMSISRKDYDDLGGFYAKTTGKIFNGAKPRNLKQEFKEPLKIAINTETAHKIDYKIPPAVLKIADEIYDHIETGSFKAE